LLSLLSRALERIGVIDVKALEDRGEPLREPSL
jgi:hypothetical protein